MPAMQEISRPQPHVPTTFERLTQGSTARAVQVEAFRQAQLDFAREGLVLVGSPEPLTPEPQSHTPSFVKRFALPTAAALSVISLACSPQAESPSPTSLYPVAVAAGKEPTPILIEPGGAYNEVRESQAAAIANATATAEAKPSTPAGQGGGGQPEVNAPVQEVLTQEQLIAKVDSIIDKIKNPDPELMSKYQVVEDRAVQQINNILYGADPKSITNAQQFLPNSLAGVRAAIQEGNYALARERIIKVFPELSNPFGGQDPQKTDRVILQKAELEILDPDQVFSPASKLDRNVRREVVSAVKKDAVVETIKLYYSLPPQGK